MISVIQKKKIIKNIFREKGKNLFNFKPLVIENTNRPVVVTNELNKRKNLFGVLKIPQSNNNNNNNNLTIANNTLKKRLFAPY